MSWLANAEWKQRPPKATLLVQHLTMTNSNGYSKVSKAKTTLIASYHNKRHLGPICEKSTQSQL
jgi:hypothetical protein